MPVLLRLALRSLARNRRRSGLTLGAVAFAVAVVVFGHGFGEGLLRVLVEQTVLSRTGALQIHKRGYLEASEASPLKLDIEDGEALRARIRSVDGVAAVAPRLRFGALLGDGAVSAMVLAAGYEPASEVRVCPAHPDSVKAGRGSWLQADDERAGVLGAELAKSLHAKPGSTLTLLASGREGAMNALDVEVAGVSEGAALFESKRVLEVPLSFAQELLQMQGRVTEYAVGVDDLARVPAVKAQLQALLGPEYEVSSWEDVVPFLRDTVFRMRVVLTGVSVVLFVIVVFGVVNTMLMTVYERVREIGTMLAVGFKRRQVMRLFLVEAAVLGALGGAVGAALGLSLTALLFARGIEFSVPGSELVQVIRPVPRPDVAGLAVVVAAAGACLAALQPARKASRMNPVDALRSN